MNNPSFGFQKPVVNSGGGGIATVGSYSGRPAPDTGPWDAFKQSRQYGGSRRDGVISSGGRINRNSGYSPFAEPDIPEERIWEGGPWTPSEGYESSVVDTGALVAATDALLKEKMGGEMSEAARRFGQMGALQSGGGLGGGYAGTLGESERGYRRDLSEITNRYRFQAEQADADRRRAAYDNAMNRELSAYEGSEGRRFGAYGMGADYDRFKYGAQVDAAGRSQRDRINEMLALYGG
jgi:hypothetical protein